MRKIISKIMLAVWLVMFLTALPCRAEDPNQWMYGYYGLESDPNTAALWHLDDDATGRLDNTGNNHDWGDAQYPVVWDPNGKFNGAVEYAFGYDFPRILEMPSAGFNTLGVSDSNSGITVELWFKTDRAQQQAFLFTALATEGYAIRVDNDSGVGRYIEGLFLVGDVGLVNMFSTSPIDDNQWHHVALTRNKATGQNALYFDGVVEASVTLGAGKNIYGQDSANAIAARLGWPLISPGVGFYGLIDEVRISSVARWQDELVQPPCYSYPSMDFTGPNSVPDCYVNMYDFAAFASSWLNCTAIEDPNCNQ